MFEMMQDEMIAKLADIIEVRYYEKDQNIVTQGEVGAEMYILEEGEAHAWGKTGDDVQEYMRYHGGSALVRRHWWRRAASASRVSRQTSGAAFL